MQTDLWPPQCWLSRLRSRTWETQSLHHRCCRGAVGLQMCTYMIQQFKHEQMFDIQDFTLTWSQMVFQSAAVGWGNRVLCAKRTHQTFLSVISDLNLVALLKCWRVRLSEHVAETGAEQDLSWQTDRRPSCRWITATQRYSQPSNTQRKSKTASDETYELHFKSFTPSKNQS